MPVAAGAMREERSAVWAYAAMLAAMLTSSGNFLFGNLAIREIEPLTLTFWRTAIALACVVPFALQGKHDLMAYFRRQKVKVLVLSVTGVILPAWLMYLSLRSHLVIDLSVGYTLIPLMAVLFSALLWGERLSAIQYLGLAAAFLGALVCAFEGELSNLARFDPHAGFVWMMAVCLTRSLYLVLLRKWDMHPSPGEGLFVLLALGMAILIPGFIGQEVASGAPLDYSWPVWGSIAFIGIGMGALYLHLISFGTGRIGASQASLFIYTVPLLVTAESVLSSWAAGSMPIRSWPRCSSWAACSSCHGFGPGNRTRARRITEASPRVPLTSARGASGWRSGGSHGRPSCLEPGRHADPVDRRRRGGICARPRRSRGSASAHGCHAVPAKS